MSNCHRKLYVSSILVDGDCPQLCTPVVTDWGEKRIHDEKSDVGRSISVYRQVSGMSMYPTKAMTHMKSGYGFLKGGAYIFHQSLSQSLQFGSFHSGRNVKDREPTENAFPPVDQTAMASWLGA